MTESYTISLYNGGLKEEIDHSVRMFKPASLIDVFSLSKLQEAAMPVNRNRSAPLLATPKTTVMGVNSNRNVGNGVRSNHIVHVNHAKNVLNRPFKRLT